MDEIEKIYGKLFEITGGSFAYIESPGLKLAHTLCEEKYPDKYTKAREIDRKISELKRELERVLIDEDEDEDY